MSFSSPKIESPVERYYEFKSKKKEFTYYNKEKKENIPLKLPAYLVVLDELSTVSGYSKKFKSGGYSNEVRNPKTDEMHVKTYNGEFSADGLWGDIKLEVGGTGGLKFSKAVYALLLSSAGDSLVCFKLTASAMSVWIDKGIDTQNHIIKICDKFNVEENGDNTYNIPIFEPIPITNDVALKATEADKKLQQFFVEKLSGARG